MPMCVVITRDVEDRYRGFLGSAMLELAPGVYAHPRMNSGVRDRIWKVIEDWFGTLGSGSIVMTWGERQAAGSLGMRSLGHPPKQVVDHEGVLLVRRPVNSIERSAQDSGSLKT